MRCFVKYLLKNVFQIYKDKGGNMKLTEIIFFFTILILILPKLFSILEFIYDYKIKILEAREKVIVLQEAEIEERKSKM